MRKHLFYSLLGAAFLLAACEQPLLDVNPNFDPETNSVKTQFVFNIADISSDPSTKQIASATQAATTETFRGISEAKLLTAAVANGNGKIFCPDKDMEKLYDLSDLIAAGTINNTDSRRVIEISLPLQTNQMLFYGRAHEGAAISSSANNNFLNSYDRYGHLATETEEGLNGYKVGLIEGSMRFSMARRLVDNNYSTMAKYLSCVLSDIMRVSINLSALSIAASAAPSGITTADSQGRVGYPYGYDITGGSAPYTGTLSWVDYAFTINGDTWTARTNSPLETSHDLYPLEQKLSDVYKEMVTIYNTTSVDSELRAASGEAILKMIHDLWAITNSVRCASPLNETECVAKYFADQIHSRLRRYFNLETYNDGSVADLSSTSFIAVTSENASMINGYFEGLSNKPTSLTGIYNVDPVTFPHKYSIPRGATHVVFDKTIKEFSYPSVFNTEGMGSSISVERVFNEYSYLYPAELLYFGNSPIRTSDKTKKESEYPTGVTNWSNDSDSHWADFNGQFVAASTHSVAMKHNINYGVALLETHVKYGSLGENGQSGDSDYYQYLEDNNHNIQLREKPGLDASQEPNKRIKLSDAKFTLTGVIIGGQSKHVGWDFLPIKHDYTNALGHSVNDYEEGFVYDKDIAISNAIIPTSGTSGANYTVVFDNYMGTLGNDGYYTDANNQKQVYVALEFRNDTEDFYGNQNLIRKGGYFYIIGVLDPTQNTLAEPDWHTDGYVTPPYRSNPTSSTVNSGHTPVKRVFIQDFKTVVNFVLGKDSLKHAYLTVPDLSSNSMTLGLSVDMKWETGLDFGDVVLGGN